MNSDREMSDLEAALRGDLPTAEDSARVRARLAAVGVLVASAATGSVAGAATVAVEGTSLAARVAALSWSTKFAVVTAVSVGVGAGAVATMQSPSTPKASSVASAPLPSSVRPAPVRRALPTAERVAVAPPPASAPAPLRSAAREVRPSAAPVANTPSTAPESTAPSTLGFPTDAADASTLREERALVDGALIALSSGDRARAAALLATHARRFPNGLLRVERERARAKLDANTP